MDPSLLAERLEAGGGLVLRLWRPADATALTEAVTESLGHLRPWMAWAAEEPLPVERRRAMIKAWAEDWRGGGDVVLGVFAGEEIAGGAGLHRRIGPGGLEIGYWTRAGFLRRGVATEATRALTGAALALPGINHVEIHHDRANEASAGIPRRLGYRLVGEAPDEPEAPAEIGIEWRWRMTAAEWPATTPA